ncbi:HNH endonuclease [Zeimonas sediminis]|uniref:HNH endonuclease n=1 Tax=Zeimonas sediminis TaxID=2944268 RepID=UPI003AF098DA
MTNLQSLRQQAARRQSLRCYYCECPMWERDATTLSASFGLSKAQANLLRCTAEHLRPKSEGGPANRTNIVAACLFCNRTRHKAKNPRCPESYKKYVRKRMQRGRWLTGLFVFRTLE